MTWITAGLVALLPLSWWQGRRHASSAQKSSEDASIRLQLFQAHQRALMDSIDDIAWLKDRDSRFLMVNRKFAELFERTPETMIGLSDYDISPAETAARYQQIDRDVMAARSAQRVEEQILCADGRTNWAETIKVPVFDERGEVIGTGRRRPRHHGAQALRISGQLPGPARPADRASQPPLSGRPVRRIREETPQLRRDLPRSRQFQDDQRHRRPLGRRRDPEDSGGQASRI